MSAKLAVYVLLSKWENFDGTPNSSHGTHGYPTFKSAMYAKKLADKQHPNEWHEIVEAPPDTPLLDINWENFHD